MKIVDVGERKIGDAQPTYIIAEIGINHGGSVERAKEMVDAAWQSGADAVKIQSFITDDFLHKSHPSYQYDVEAEISKEKELEIWEYAGKKEINLFATPEEFRSLSFIKSLSPNLVKIAAMDFNYKDLVVAAARINKPIILSSGMCSLEEVLRTVRWVKEAGNDRYIVLHCVSNYPSEPKSCNLNAIRTLKNSLNCPVGFSDHTVGIHIALTAVALGANVIEKHFTLDHTQNGPDHRCSADPGELRQLVSQIRDFESARGDGVKRPAIEENEPRVHKRRGIYAIDYLSAGTLLTKKNVLFLAPSSETSTLELWPRMERARLNKDVPARQLIEIGDIE
ncbi:N-acetylneuraminate synthase (EC [Olavius algarvensis Delta 1 endosymbiont]|nr:N-acetylneuraminate synthase (EC [Olavius algarvensis Delta 1 endosymbiont]